MNILKGLMRRFRQKELLRQIFSFLDSKSVRPNLRKEYEEWLLEFLDHTKAHKAKEITYIDLTNFAAYVANRESSEYFRKEAAKVIHRFMEYCKREKFIRDFPRENASKDDVEEVKKNIVNKIVSKKAPARKSDYEMIKLVKEIYDGGDKLSFEDVAKILSKKFNKTFQRQNIWRWYHMKMSQS